MVGGFSPHVGATVVRGLHLSGGCSVSPSVEGRCPEGAGGALTDIVGEKEKGCGELDRTGQLGRCPPRPKPRSEEGGTGGVCLEGGCGPIRRAWEPFLTPTETSRGARPLQSRDPATDLVRLAAVAVADTLRLRRRRRRCRQGGGASRPGPRPVPRLCDPLSSHFGPSSLGPQGTSISHA